MAVILQHMPKISYLILLFTSTLLLKCYAYGYDDDTNRESRLSYLPQLSVGKLTSSRGGMSDTSDAFPTHNRCEFINISICRNLPYNMTIMPNLMGHTKQEEAGTEVHQFSPLVKIGCSPDLQLFLCSLYLPVCTILEMPIPPCRSLCESARLCETFMRTYNFNWPENLECTKFPVYGGKDLCVAENKTSSTDTPQHAVGKVTARKNHTPEPNGSQFHRDIGFVCPVQLKIPRSMGYALRVGNRELHGCGAPCNSMFFQEEERVVLRYWVGSWAAICVASCLFTILTFLIDASRFRYPERAIVFLAICYLAVGLAYIIGFFARDSVACREPFPPPVRLDRLQMLSTITQGYRQSTSCTVLFMALYFCCMAAFAWWSCLTFAWFLAAGLKWGHEAIENKSHLFHLVAWAIPAIQTICVLALTKVEGDVLSGVCFVGQLDKHSLGVFLILPLCIYLIIGGLFLLAGFISLFRIRTVMKTDGKRTDKLERLMMRIGFFSGLFILPALGYLTCLFYEYLNIDSWLVQWHSDICKAFSIPCPIKQDKTVEARPIFQIYIAKYLCSMLVGVTSSVWMYSGKTVISWRNFIRRLKGENFRSGPQVHI